MNMRISLLIVTFVALVLFFVPEILTSKNNGAQLTSNYTGAPGFPNCTQCHSGVANSGDGGINVVGNFTGSIYVPGDTYELNVTINSGSAASNKYGFMLAAMQGNSYLGTLQALNTDCQVEPGGRWITHTISGNAGGTSSKTYTFNWTAPAQGSGAVSFYVAGNAANGNGNTNGDNIYVLSNPLVVNEQPSSSFQNYWNIFPAAIYPNPAREFLYIDAPGYDITKYFIYDFSGKLVQSNFLNQKNRISVPLELLPSGEYIFIVQDSKGRISGSKFIKY